MLINIFCAEEITDHRINKACKMWATLNDLESCPTWQRAELCLIS